jgi:endonuclease YncB( thermonuclease family)
MLRLALRLFLALATVIVAWFGAENAPRPLACTKHIGDRFGGTVGAVADGDTFTIGVDRVRLWGIDAPEKGEPDYHAATRAMRAMAHGQRAMCEVRKIDRYTRCVAVCSIEGAGDPAMAMVRQGLADPDLRYIDEDPALGGAYENAARIRVRRSDPGG